jgi:hypothetical protein
MTFNLEKFRKSINPYTINSFNSFNSFNLWVIRDYENKFNEGFNAAIDAIAGGRIPIKDLALQDEWFSIDTCPVGGRIDLCSIYGERVTDCTVNNSQLATPPGGLLVAPNSSSDVSLWRNISEFSYWMRLPSFPRAYSKKKQRVKIRIPQIHDDIKDEDLPWKRDELQIAWTDRD